MLTGPQRRTQYQIKYPGKTIARKSSKEQEEIKEHNKKFFDEILQEQKNIRETKLNKARQAQEEGVIEVIKYLGNKNVKTLQEAKLRASEVVDSLKIS